MSTELIPSAHLATLERDTRRAPAVLAWAESLEIASDDDASWAAEKLRDIKTFAKTAEEQRTSVTKPLNEALRNFNAMAKRVLEPLARAEALVKGKLAAYTAAREADRVQAMHEAANGDAAALARTAPAAPLEGVTMRETWDFEVTDPALVPREYCVVDPKKIRALATSSTEEPTSVPGVRWFRRSVVSARTAV